jgi:hypothetical protein
VIRNADVGNPNREIMITSKITKADNPDRADQVLKAKYSAVADRWVPWGILLLLLILCTVEGIRATAGLQAASDVDSWRDVGFSQGFLDGNLFGDPAYAGEWRWYPPLMHGLGALGVWLSGASPMSFWVRIGPWINLLAPLTFFLMNARLFGRPAAVVATAVFVLFNGTFTYPYIDASYTPQPLTPNLTLPLFFLGITLIHARGSSTRIRDAAVIGIVLGIVFLSHTVPALLLSAIVTTTAFSQNGTRLRTFLWLTVVALVELAWGLPFLGPLFIHYRLHIANPAPGAWMDALMAPSLGSWLRLVGLNLPGLLAAAGAWLLRRRAPVDHRTVVIIGTWIAVCLTFLFRHEACVISNAKGAVCETFVISAHHYHFYLSAAWASLMGHTVWQGARWWAETTPGRPSSPRVAALSAVAVVTLALGTFCFLFRPYAVDVYHWVRRTMQPAFEIRTPELVQNERPLDIEAYNWIVAHTRPSDLFVTADADYAVFAVIAAGRRLVAAPELHSNPYIAWASRDARRLRFIAAISGQNAASTRALCDLLAERGGGNTAFFLLPNQDLVNTDALEIVWHGNHHSLYRVKPITCRPDDPGDDQR